MSSIQPRHLAGLSRRFVTEVKAGRINNKYDALRILFKNSKYADLSYYQLMRKIRRDYMLALSMSIKADSEYRRAEIEIYSAFTSAMLLFGSGKIVPAIFEANKALKIAKEYEFLQIASILCLKLIRCYSEIKPNESKRKYYKRLAKEYADLISEQTNSEMLYSEIIIKLGNRQSYTRYVIDMLDKYSNSMSLRTTSSIFQYYTLKVIHCFAIQDYPQGAATCQDALKLLEDRPAATVGQKFRFILYRAVCAIAAGQYQHAENSLIEAQDFPTLNDYNKQILNYYRAINALHNGKYFYAQYLRDEALKQKLFPTLIEYWAIISAYLYFFNGGRKFKLGKFFNETVDASKDKQGQNINIIICDLIISITDRRDRFIHRIEAVQNYVYRHLRGKQTERAKIFLEMLFQVPKADFYPRRIKQLTYRKAAMIKRRSVYANHNLEIEIVPFETLWDKILERLASRQTIRAIG